MLRTAGATLAMAAATVELGPGDRVLGTGFHVVGPALLGGASVVVPPARSTPERLAKVTRRLDISHVTLPLTRR